MILDNFINIVCDPVEGKDESNMGIEYSSDVTVSELVTTLEMAKMKILKLYNDYNDRNGIFEDQDMERIYFRTPIKNLIE